ncbi:hypothetical protein [Shewanella canadensis]|uniref:hypothetical protein n=1 Tax=Shewanella canadensis TaxID=271096 RepID=UPI001FE78C2D|nr:hypothetical protein [Shewanella canadensis]
MCETKAAGGTQAFCSVVQIAETGNKKKKTDQTAVSSGQKNEQKVEDSAKEAIETYAKNTGKQRSANGNENSQGLGAVDAIKEMASVFWDYRDEIIAGAVDLAADSITDNTGGIIDGDSLTEITGVRSGADAIIAVGQGDAKGVLAAGVGVIVGKAKIAKNLLDKTPLTDPNLFRSVRGCKADCNIKTGEIWEKDLLHKNQPHYEVYKNRKNYDKGKRDRAVWEDGRPKQEFKK